MKKLSSAIVLLLLACLDGSIAKDTPSSEVCGLTGYDLGTLYEADYWLVRVPQNVDCVLPLGYNESSVAGCNIIISVCKPLGDHICPGHPNSTTCQQVVMEDDREFFYDMGGYMGNTEFQALSNKTGFLTDRIADDATNSSDCVDTISTKLFFLCDPDTAWNSSGDGNVTQHLIVADQLLLNPCSYLVQVNYSGACYTAPTLSPSHCSIEGYDTGSIASRDYWIAHVDSSACFDSGEFQCVLYLAFCHSVPSGLAANCTNAAVCQKGSDGEGNVLELSLGSYTNFTHFYENDESDDNAGFHMRVENGSKPQNGTVCKNGLQSEVILVCNPDTPWNSQDISDFVQLAYHHSDDPCLYVIKISYSGACVDDPGVSKSKVSPVGWIFIGIFLAAVLSYLIIGSAVGYFVKGERGVRVLPHYDFWKGVAALIMEGCKFSWETITCHRFDGKMSTSRGQPDYDKI